MVCTRATGIIGDANRFRDYVKLEAAKRRETVTQHETVPAQSRYCFVRGRFRLGACLRAAACLRVARKQAHRQAL